jgi:hypothetical protein
MQIQHLEMAVMPVMVVCMAVAVAVVALVIQPVACAETAPKALSSLSMSRLPLTHWSM